MKQGKTIRFGYAERAEDVQADGLIRLVLQGDPSPERELPAELGAALKRMVSDGIFTGKPGQAEAVPTHGYLTVPYLLLVGLGTDGRSTDAWRDAGVYAARLAGKYKLGRLAVETAAASDESFEERLAALAEGMLLGAYRMKTYRLHAAEESWPAEVMLPAADEAARMRLRERLGMSTAFADATNYARDLTNMPGNLLVPETMAQEARRIASRHGLRCTIHDEREIVSMGMYGLHHVGKGSANPPRMIVMQYDGAPDSAERIGLVGKGITFDTGGISMKPPGGMEEMISDMGGGAVLLGVMDAIGRLKPRINVTTVIPAAENMPSGSAFKPGDVIPMLGGRTVEVLNTDAEGRIVLADGITCVKHLGATRIIDVATLTGAILISLGDVATGALTNDEPFLQELLGAAKRCGEKLWQLPAYREYWEMLESDVADVRNQTGSNKWAGAITAGLFAGVFAEDTPWIHLDTGGTAWLWHERGTEPKGGTGAMVRTLLTYLCSKGT